MKNEKWYVRGSSESNYVKIMTEISDEVLAEYRTLKSNYENFLRNAEIMVDAHNKMLKFSNTMTDY
jgi:hypothetical protein